MVFSRLDIESACPQTKIIDIFFMWPTELISGLEMLSISPLVARKGSASPMRMSLGYPAPGGAQEASSKMASNASETEGEGSEDHMEPTYGGIILF